MDIHGVEELRLFLLMFLVLAGCLTVIAVGGFLVVLIGALIGMLLFPGVTI
jgi:uncharacterized membrane protein YjjP (DUF1212 family)